MARIQRLALFAISIAILIAGCGDSTGDYGLFRSRDLITVFVPIDDTSEVTKVNVNHEALHIDIDTREEIVHRVISLQHRFFEIVESDETLEIHGENKINDYAVIHLRVFNSKRKGAKVIKHSAYKFGFKTTKPGEIPGPLADSGVFRFGDKIMAYCLLHDNMYSGPKTFFKVHKSVKSTNTVKYNEITAEEKDGYHILTVEKYRIDSDITLRDLRFVIKGLEPDETVKLEEIKNLGNRIAIAELVVVPQESQAINDVVPKDR